MDSHKVEVGKNVTILALRQLIRDWRTNESLDILLTYTLSPTQPLTVAMRALRSTHTSSQTCLLR